MTLSKIKFVLMSDDILFYSEIKYKIYLIKIESDF